MALDGAPIFRGELRQAPGSVAGALQHAELILFTEDPAALAAIEWHDQRYLRQLSPPEGAAGAGRQAQAAPLDLVTAGPQHVCGQLLPAGCVPAPGGRQQLGSDGRPHTAALGTVPAAAAGAVAAAAASSRAGGSSRVAPSGGVAAGLLRCRELALVLLDTWGDSHFIGLAGLEVLGPGGQALPLAATQVAADPPGLNVFPGHSGGCTSSGAHVLAIAQRDALRASRLPPAG